MLENTIVLVFYIMVVCHLTVSGGLKIYIILMTIILHRPINLLQKKGADIVDITYGVVVNIIAYGFIK